MIEDPRERLVAAIATAMAYDGRFVVDTVEVSHAPRGNLRREVIRTWRRVNERERPMFSADDAVVGRLASDILSLCEQHVESLAQSRPERFRVVFHQASGDHSLHAFLLAPQYEGEDVEVERSEMDPTNAGLLREVMGQNRELHKAIRDNINSFTEGMNKIVGNLRQQNEKMIEMLEKRDGERMNYLDKLEEAKSLQHERDLEALTVNSEVERAERREKEIFGLLPAIASKFLDPDDDKDGEKAADRAQNPSELAVVLGKLGMSIDDAQKRRLMKESGLGMEQLILLQEVTRLAKKGGGMMLGQLVARLTDSLTEGQLQTLMSDIFDEDQGALFVRAMNLGKAERDAAEKTEADKTKAKEPATTKAKAKEPKAEGAA